MSASKFIDDLGGNTPVARACGVSLGAVSNWRKADLIPERWYRRLVKLAAQSRVKGKRIKVPERAFGERKAQPEARAP